VFTAEIAEHAEDGKTENIRNAFSRKVAKLAKKA
jgi:hypothetical protein